ncbi:MAG: ribosome small subunit-dependent GTPase A [Clostridia bacterium]|nr:ribosome small subunit-dependent GTPase A [Clostridia bacterium]
MENQFELGRICEIRKNSFIISFEGGEVFAKLKGSFGYASPKELPIVGDHVSFIHNPSGDSVIQRVLERKTLLSRPDAFTRGGVQYMAANVDYCFIVTSLNEDYSASRIARYTSIALAGGCVPVAILTKSDICADVEKYVREAAAVSDKIRVYAVSALTGEGMDALEEYFIPNSTICLMGSSGAGKSTLINTLAGDRIMKTAGIRERDDKGRHTTTHRQLIKLDSGVFIIDTPGMREIGVACAEDGVDDAFSDIVELEKQCRFANCRHESEPGCAVKAAIASGELSEGRLKLYRQLGAERPNNYAKMKEISKRQKAYKKQKNSEFSDD